MEQYDAIETYRVESPIGFDACLAMSLMNHRDMDLVSAKVSVIDNWTADYSLFYRYKPGVPHPFRRARTQWEEGLC